jgi:hypothetical protein
MKTRACEMCGAAFTAIDGRTRFCSISCSSRRGLGPQSMARPWQDRLLERLIKDDSTGCLLWAGTTSKRHGYGSLYVDGRQQPTHRMAWILRNGPISDGLMVLHRCDVRVCCNPDHLFLGTNRDNHDDMVTKGRGWWQRAGAIPPAVYRWAR